MNRAVSRPYVVGRARGMSWSMAIATAFVAAGIAAVGADRPLAAEPSPHLRVDSRGWIRLPDAASDQQGDSVAITGLSGVAWLGDDRYVAVMDNGRHLVLFRLALSQAGRPTAVESVRLVRLAERHDYEDVVPCPADLAARLRKDAAPATAGDRGVVLVCEEDTPAIRAFSLDDGEMLGTLPLPDNLRTRRPNRGLESLAIDPDGRHVWTANEEALPADGPDASAGGGTVVRLTRLPVPAVDPLRPLATAAADAGREPALDAFQAAYAVDPVHRHTRLLPGPTLSGLVALVALGNGRLLALERGAAPALPPFSSRICLVDVAGAIDVSRIDEGLAGRPEAVVPKRTLWAGSLGGNLEGLCAGPLLADGSRGLVGITDNGGLGTPTLLVTLAIVTPTPAVSPAVLGIAAAIVVAALVTGRFAGP